MTNNCRQINTVTALIFAALLAFAASSSVPAIASENSNAALGVHIQTLAQASISQGQAAELAKSRYGGKVLSVAKSNNGGRITYRVKLLLDSGRVIIVSVDGQSGQIRGG